MSSSTRSAVTVVPSGEKLSWNDLRDLSGRFITAMTSLGLDRGSRVALLLANQIEYPVVVLGARNGGFDHLPLNTHCNGSDMESILRQFKPDAIVAAAEFVAAVEPILDHSVQRIVVGAKKNGWLSYDKLVTQHTPASHSDNAEVGRLFLLSGGSTGCPKIVQRPNAHKRDTARKGGGLAVVPLNHTDTMLVAGPLYHTMPMGWMIGALEAGAHTVIMQKWNSELALRSIQDHRVSLLPLVPTMMRRITQLPASVRNRYSASSVKTAFHGTAPCPTSLKREFMQWIPNTWEGYGMTEGFGLTIISPGQWLERPGSVGRPVDGFRVIIRDGQGCEVPAGTVGSIWFRRIDGARMSYVGQPKATAACYNEHGEASALDLGYVDKDGYLFLAGRGKNMLIIGGVNIYPVRIEDALMSHPAVSDACVVGIPHEDLGEVPVAAVVPTTNQSPSPEELTEHCRQIVGSLATPREVHFVTELPRNATGKILIDQVRTLIGH
jgi:acyl-CoA synthetase (AMP-forming)/AMP-acid ligase II